MQISTTSFAADGPIGLRFAARGIGGENVMPALSWTGAPPGTRSFAVTIYDPDAPTGSGFWHLVAFDIPARLSSLAEGAALPAGVRTVDNDYGRPGYGGPFPPPGPAHRYLHTVHALPVEHLDVPGGALNVQVRFQIFTRRLASASVLGTFQNPNS